MKRTAQAWVVVPGPVKTPGKLEARKWCVDDPGPHDIRVEPLACAWEGNMGHALARDPIDICSLRGESEVVLGNAACVRVESVGSKVRGWEVGQRAVIWATAKADAFGFPEKILGYDAPGTMGAMCTLVNVPAVNLAAVPPNSTASDEQWAAFNVRYATAWSNWRLAYGTLRLMVTEAQLPSIHVWGWGGGSTLATLDLAKRFGHRPVFISQHAARRKTAEDLGIATLDRSEFGGLNRFGRDKREGADREGQAAQADAYRRFVQEVARRTEDWMVQIFVDYIGEPVQDATLKALGRESVVTTAGWKQGMAIRTRRALSCIRRQQFIHTHWCSRAELLEAIDYAHTEGWLPSIDEPAVAFSEVPKLAERFARGETGLFPCFRVAEK